MKAWLIQIDAYDGATATTLRMASHDDDRLCHLDGQTWWPVIAKLPTLRYDFFDGSFDGGSITSPSGTLEANIEAIPFLPRLAIHDARIRIWGGELGDAFSSFVLTFDGRVKEQPSVDGGAMSISFGADDSWLDQPMLATYAGTGGAEGGTDLEGQVKTLALGAPRFVPATLVDAVDNIYQLSGYGTLNGFEVAFERLNRFGAPSANAASFAALKSGAVTRGQWATCRAQGFVKFGAPPEGLLSFHLQGDAVGGWSRLPGDIIRRIATIAGGAARLSAADVAALNAARPWPLSIVVNAQTTARELIQRIAMSVNAVAYVDWLGVLRLSAIGIGAASMTIAADGSSLPPVADVQQIETSAPYWKIAQGAAVTWQVHGLNDIAFSAPLNPRGPYDPDETYREGDMVTLPNGSQWLFIGTTPAKGSAPADNNPNWFRLSDAITAGNITYEDGTPVEDLKPAEPGATDGMNPVEKDEFAQLAADAAAADTRIEQTEADIDDLKSTYGDTASAAASAASASTSAQAASDAASTAGTARDNSQTARDQAQAAKTAAEAAKTAAETARGDAQTAAGQSATSATAALQRAVAMLPERYQVATDPYFTGTLTGSPTAVAAVNSNRTSTDNLPVYELYASYTGTQIIDWLARGVVSAVAGRIYEVEVEFELRGRTGAPSVQIVQRSMDAGYASVGGSTNSLTYSAAGIYTLRQLYSDTANAAAGVAAWSPGAVWLRFGLRANAGGASGEALRIDGRRIRITDVTARQQAKGFSDAASVSSGLAAGSANDASGYSVAASGHADRAKTSADDSGASAAAAAASVVSANSVYTNVVNSVNAAPILPFDFRDGLKSWTSVRPGSPTTVADAAATVEADSSYGLAAQLGVTGSGSGLFTKGVLPAIAGRYYKVEVQGRYTAGDNSYSPSAQCVPLDANYAAQTVVFGGVQTVVTGQDFTCSAIFSDTASNGAVAWAPGATWLRFGFRNGTTEGAGTMARIGRIKVSDVTEQVLAIAAQVLAQGSAQAASLSASAAGTAVDDAGAYADAASDSADLASAKAENAALSSDAASRSASDAAGASTDAGNWATASQTSSVQATITVASLLPSQFGDDGKYWSSSWTGTPGNSTALVANANYAFADVANEGRILQLTNGASTNVSVAARGWLKPVVGRKYRVKARVRRTSGATSSVSLWIIGLTGLGAQANVFTTGTPLDVTGNWYDVQMDAVDGAQLLVGNAYVRPMLRSVTPNTVHEVASIELVDITESWAALQSANAAAQSASYASTSETNAGQSASSANEQRQLAETAKATAQGYAEDAAASESNASGSSSTASGYAQNAADAANDAGDYAEAASDSADLASGKAGDAGSSASAAQTSAVTAAARSADAVKTLYVSSPILISTFGEGVTHWTNDRTGDPTTRANAAGTAVANDANLGPVVEISSFTAAGANILTKGVLAPRAGRVYEVSAKLKIMTSDGSVRFTLIMANMLASYGAASMALSNGTAQTIAGTGTVVTITQKFTVGGGTNIISIPADAVFSRIGLRLDSGEGTLVFRLGELRVDDVTNRDLAAGSAVAASNSASTAQGHSEGARNWSEAAHGWSDIAQTKADDASGYADAASISSQNASSYSDDAESWSVAASGHSDTASGYADDAQGWASSAQGSASTATGAATTATQQATLAATYSTGGGNLLTNTDFSVDTSGWQNGSSGQSGLTFAINHGGASFHPELVNALSIYQANNTATGFAEWRQSISVKAGTWYDTSVFVAARRCQCEIYTEYYNAAGAALRTDSSGLITPATGGTTIAGWSQVGYKGPAAAPAGAVKATIYVRKFGTVSGSDSYFWFMRPQIRETFQNAPTPANYAPGGSGAVAATLSALVQNNASTIATATSALAELSLATRAGNPNLLKNATAEGGLAYWGTPNGGSWTTGNNAFGSYFWLSAITPTVATNYLLQSQQITVDPGTIYTFTGDTTVNAATSAVSGVFAIAWYKADGTFLSDSYGPSKPATYSFVNDGANRSAMKVSAVAPATAAFAQVRFYVSVPANAQLYNAGVRMMKFERGATATPYSNEASAALQFTAYQTLTTQYASLSSTVETQGITISDQATAISELDGDVATLLGRWGFEIDVNGYVSGMVMNNNGQRADVTFRSDRFRIVPPSGTTDGYYVDIDSSGRTTQYIRSGSVRVVESGWLV